jgi:hypothetical protein
MFYLKLGCCRKTKRSGDCSAPNQDPIHSKYVTSNVLIDAHTFALNRLEPERPEWAEAAAAPQLDAQVAAIG